MTSTFSISLDPDAFALPPTSDFATDAAILDAFLDLARDAGATFANARVVPNTDTHAFAYDIVVAFDATATDVARYAAAYDAPDAITPA